MLLQMLTERGTLTFGQSLLLSGIGMTVVLMELAGLKGREKIAGYRLESAICYPGK